MYFLDVYKIINVSLISKNTKHTVKLFLVYTVLFMMKSITFYKNLMYWCIGISLVLERNQESGLKTINLSEDF